MRSSSDFQGWEERLYHGWGPHLQSWSALGQHVNQFYYCSVSKTEVWLNLFDWPWLPPGHQVHRMVKEMLLKEEGQQRCDDEEEPPAAVPRCQGKQCKPGALERRVFDPPNSQMHFQTWKCMKLNFHGSRFLKPGNVKEELQLLGAWKEVQRKTLFDMLECISLRYTISIIKFTRNNIYIHHISLIKVSSGNQKNVFAPMELSHPLISPTVKVLDPSLRRRNHSFARPIRLQWD